MTGALEPPFFYSHAYRCIVALQARRQKGQEPGRERVELKVFCNSHGLGGGGG